MMLTKSLIRFLCMWSHGVVNSKIYGKHIYAPGRTKRYFFVLCYRLIRWVKTSFLNNNTFFINGEVSAYKVFRLVELSWPGIAFDTRFFLFQYKSKCLSISQVRLKVNFSLLLFSPRYMDFFRQFKFLEFIRKNNLIDVIPTKMSFLHYFQNNFLLNSLLIYVFPHNKPRFKLVASIPNHIGGLFTMLINCLFILVHSQIYVYIFKFFKKFCRLYLLIFIYTLYFSFKSALRPYSMFKVGDLASLFSLLIMWKLPLDQIMFKSFFISIWTLFSVSLESNWFIQFFNFDKLTITKVFNFVLIDYLYRTILEVFQLMQYRFKNNRKRQFFKFRKLFIILLRCLFSYSRNLGLSAHIHHKFTYATLEKLTVDLITWQIFHQSSIVPVTSLELWRMSTNITHLMQRVDQFFFHMYFIFFKKIYQINKNVMYIFLIRMVIDFLVKAQWVGLSELNKSYFINCYTYWQVYNRNQYKMFYANYLAERKLFKFDNYLKLNSEFYTE